MNFSEKFRNFWTAEHVSISDDEAMIFLNEHSCEFKNFLQDNFYKIPNDDIHPVLRKHMFCDRYNSILSWYLNCIEYFGSHKDYENFLLSQEMRHAKNLQSLPQKYLTEDDKNFIASITIKKLTL